MNKKRGELGVKSLAVLLIIVLIFIVVRVFAATTTITDVSTAASTLLNVTIENNFSHLSIGDSSIGFINSSNLVLYMPFDTNNNSAGKTYDYSARGNDGTLESATWNSSGVYGRAYQFSGTNANNISTPITTTILKFTLVAWIKSYSSANEQYIITAVLHDYSL